MTKKLIYIVGAGRSGTTVLDIMLGNNSNVVSLGEINRFYKRSGLPPGRTYDSETYQFWRKISSKLKEKKHDDFIELNALFHTNEYHSFFFKSFFKINDRKYRSFLNDMYIAVNENISEEIIVESSKYPSRALNVSSYVSDKEVKVYYIYLKKEPFSVVSSFQKVGLEQPKKGFLAANIYYFLVNLLCEVTVFKLKRRGHKVKTIKYNDLIGNPTKCLNELEVHFKMDMQELIEKVINKKPLHTGCLFDGNRIRLEETIVIKSQKNKIKKPLKYYFTRVFNYIVYH